MSASASTVATSRRSSYLQNEADAAVSRGVDDDAPLSRSLGVPCPSESRSDPCDPRERVPVGGLHSVCPLVAGDPSSAPARRAGGWMSAEPDTKRTHAAPLDGPIEGARYPELDAPHTTVFAVTARALGSVTMALVACALVSDPRSTVTHRHALALGAAVRIIVQRHDACRRCLGRCRRASASV